MLFLCIFLFWRVWLSKQTRVVDVHAGWFVNCCGGALPQQKQAVCFSIGTEQCSTHPISHVSLQKQRDPSLNLSAVLPCAFHFRGFSCIAATLQWSHSTHQLFSPSSFHHPTKPTYMGRTHYGGQHHFILWHSLCLVGTCCM